MTTILLPYHQDERLDDRSIVLPDRLAATVVDPGLDGADQWQRLAVLYETLAAPVQASVRAGGPTTVVAGDCVAVVGTLAGMQRAGVDPTVVWFDAHGDVHTLASSESGYLGGMALRWVLGGDADRLGASLGLRPVAEDRTVLVDARDLDAGEVDYLASSAVRQVTVEGLAAADVPDGPVLLHVDLDVVDAAELPGLRFPAPDGPTSDAVLEALRRLLDSGRVSVLEVSCPWLETTDDEQARRRAELVAAVLALQV